MSVLLRPPVHLRSGGEVLARGSVQVPSRTWTDPLKTSSVECGGSNNGQTCCQAARSRRRKQRFLSNEVICSTFLNNGKTKSDISAASSCQAGRRRHSQTPPTDLIHDRPGQKNPDVPTSSPSIKLNQPSCLCFQKHQVRGADPNIPSCIQSMGKMGNGECERVTTPRVDVNPRLLLGINRALEKHESKSESSHLYGH